MHRRTVLKTLGSGTLLCLCECHSIAQMGNRSDISIKPPPHVPVKKLQPFCTFSRPARQGGTGIQAYDLKPDGGRPRSQLSWSFNGSLPGIAAPLTTLALSFAAWRALDAAPILGFHQIGSGGDIVLSVADLGAPDKSGLQILAVTASDGSTIQFTSRRTWIADSLQLVATHEIGHALGLLHATTSNSIMYPIDQGQNVLGSDDKAAIRALYGWSAQTKMEGGTMAAPALVACGGILARAWRGTDDDHNLYWASTGDFFVRNWTGVQKIGDRGSSHTPRIAFAGGSMVMVWKGVPGDSGLYYARFSGGWGVQHKIGGVGSACAPAICQDLDPNAVRMAWRGVNDDQNLYTSTLSDQYWQPQEKVSWIINGNGAEGTAGIGYPGTADSPALANFADKVILAWRGVVNDEGLWLATL